jgi:hypothetical protein
MLRFLLRESQVTKNVPRGRRDPNGVLAMARDTAKGKPAQTVIQIFGPRSHQTGQCSHRSR